MDRSSNYSFGFCEKFVSLRALGLLWFVEVFLFFLTTCLADAEQWLVCLSERKARTVFPWQEQVTKVGGSVRPLMPSGTRVELTATTTSVPVWRRLWVVTIPNGDPVAGQLVAEIQSSPDVQWVEPDRPVTLCIAGPDSSLFPDDAEFFEQWNLYDRRPDGRGFDISAPDAWVVTTGTVGIVVAVIDSGVDFFHPDLAENIWRNINEEPGNAIDDDGDGYIDDWCGFDFVNRDPDPMDDIGHGTHVAGILGAVGNNGRGIAGVAWQVRIMCLKAFDRDGQANVSTIVEAIGFAVEHGARIINASWGTVEQSISLVEAVREAARRGVLVVCAAGNLKTDRPFYPAALPEAIAVAATDRDGRRASFSNYGSWVDVAAPGSQIYSLWPNSRYMHLSGTSMATPHVSGAAVLVWAVHPEFSAKDVFNAIKQTAEEAEWGLGYGRINLARAVNVVAPLPEVRLKVPSEWNGYVDIVGAVEGQWVRSWRLLVKQEGTDWTEIASGTGCFEEGMLVQRFDVREFRDGLVFLRLIAEDSWGQVAHADATAWVKNVKIESPAVGDVVRHGDVIPVYGATFGKDGIVRLEWASGWKPTAWQSNGIELVAPTTTDGVRLLAYWHTDRLQPDQMYHLRLSLEDSSGRQLAVTNSAIYLSSRLRPGWPVYMPSRDDFPTNDWRQISVVDLDGDGRSEVIVVIPGSPDGTATELAVLDLGGQLVWSKPIGKGIPYYDIPAFGDLNGDGKPDVVAGADEGGLVWAFDFSGAVLPGWPVRVVGCEAAKVVADVDGDGANEVVVFAGKMPPGGPAYRELAVFRGDGSCLARWRLGVRGEFDVERPLCFPAVGDLDGDGQLEIVAVSGRQVLSAYDLERPDEPIWSFGFPGALLSSPVIADLDGDGRPEIIVGVYDPAGLYRSMNGGVWVLESDGTLRHGWPVLQDQSFIAEPVVLNADLDPELEIAIPSWYTYQLHLLRPDGMEEIGWPLSVNGSRSFRSYLTAVRIGQRPLLCTLMPGNTYVYLVSGLLNSVGGVMAWWADGQEFSFGDNRFGCLVMEGSSSFPTSKGGAAVTGDLDGNGYLDIVAATIADFFVDWKVGIELRPKGRFTVYAWELPIQIEQQDLLWSTFRGDNSRGGYRPVPCRLNQAPRLIPIADQLVSVGGSFHPLQLRRYVVDPDDPFESLQWQFEWRHGYLSYRFEQGVLLVEPPSAEWEGEALLLIRVEDPHGAADEKEVWFRALRDYRPPTAIPDQIETDEDRPISFNVLQNDIPGSGKLVRLVSVSSAQHGSVQLISESGVVAYKPDENYFGPDEFEYTVADEFGGTAFGQVTITVRAVPDPPVCEPDFARGLEDEPIEINPLANDKDPDGDEIILVGIGHEPRWGTIELKGGGVIKYNPKPDWSGSDYFTYRVKDATGLLSEGEVFIQVDPVNDPPTAFDMWLEVNRNRKLNIQFNSYDVDGDRLSYEIVEPPQHGELWVYPDVAEYYPSAGFTGSDRFIYRANDGQAKSGPATVYIKVLDRNNPPEAASIRLTIRTNRVIDIPLVAEDPDKDQITFKIVQPPACGKAEIVGNYCRYYTQPDYSGPDRLLYCALDPFDEGPPAAIDLIVTTTNTAPRAQGAYFKVIVNEPTALPLPVTDEEWDQLSIQIVQGPYHGRLEVEGTNVVYVPNYNYLGPDRFSYKAFDGDLWSSEAPITLLVMPDNHPPIVSDQNVRVETGKTNEVKIQMADQDGDSLQVVILDGPKKCFATARGDVVLVTVGNRVWGDDKMTIMVWDGYEYSRVATIGISFVQSYTGPPVIQCFKVVGGQLILQIRLTSGLQYVLEASEDLRNWEEVQRFMADSSLVTLAIDLKDRPLRFYRIIQISSP